MRIFSLISKVLNLADNGSCVSHSLLWANDITLLINLERESDRRNIDSHSSDETLDPLPIRGLQHRCCTDRRFCTCGRSV
mmetsp:Transcript_2290/g.3648  ORF Transcript_2290/g.3648 Transcript_2290/m.3648 type:complete len:80 (+) Transcript_2290:336-575(+)